MVLVGVIIALVVVAAGVFFIVLTEPYKQQTPGDVYKTKIAGVNMRTGTRAFAGMFFDCLLVPDPENPHDANAIKIVEASTGTHMGYIPAKETGNVRSFIRNDFSHTHRAYIEEIEGDDDSFLVGEIEIKRT